MRRLLCSFGLAAILFLHSVIVFATPTPSPGLDGILIKPPSTTYKEAPKAALGIFEGPFDAAKYAEVTAAPDAAGTALTKDGFLTGFGRTWATAKNAHVIVEAVIAFAGAKGAKASLQQSEAADKANPNFFQALTISGIDTYFGVRLIDKVHRIYADAFVFVKGNDLILVKFVSNKNDLASVAATQTKKQFDATPPYTIPPDQWPESKVVSSSPFDGLKTIGLIVAALFVLGVIGAGGFILWSRRRPALQLIPAQQTSPGAMPVVAETPAAVAVAVASPPAPLQMSEDGRSWWDGAAWRDAEHEVPPAAQRSDDGHFWWDGATWHPMPPSPFGG